MIWIKSAVYDGLFFSCLWWIPVCLLSFQYFKATVGLGLFFVLYHVFIRLPHFFATYPLTYLRRENWRHYVEHWCRYFVVPVFILAVYFCVGLNPNSHPLNMLLIAIAHLWGVQHIAMQNYGILQIYHSRAGTLSPFQRWAEKSVSWMIFVSAALSRGDFARMYNNDHFWSMLSGIRAALNLGLGGLVVIILLNATRGGLKRIPEMTFFLSAVLSTIYWPLYDSLAGSNGKFLFFYIINGQHSIAYIALSCFMLAKRRGVRLPAPLRGRNAALRLAGYLFVLIGFSILLMSLATGFHLFDWPSVRHIEPFRVLASLEGFFVVHYYLESFSWNHSSSHARSHMLALLAPIRAVHTPSKFSSTPPPSVSNRPAREVSALRSILSGPFRGKESIRQIFRGWLKAGARSK